MVGDDMQAELFERLADRAGMTAKEIDRFTHCGIRQAYRLICGASPLTFEQARALLNHPSDKVAAIISEALFDGKDRVLVTIRADRASDVDSSAIVALEDCTAFLRQRRQDTHDGRVTDDERAREIEVANELVRAAHRLRYEVEHQPVVQRAQETTAARSRRPEPVIPY